MQSEGVSRRLAPRDWQKEYRRSWRDSIVNTSNWPRREAVTNFRLLYAHTFSDLHLNLAHSVVVQLLHVDRYERGKTNINPWSRVVLEKLMFCHVFKNLATFYGTRNSITTFATACQLSLSSARLIQSTPHRPICRKTFLILLSHLGLGFSSGLLPPDFSTKTLYAHLLSLPSRSEAIYSFSYHATCLR
jgi:hypothetical protein